MTTRIPTLAMQGLEGAVNRPLFTNPLLIRGFVPQPDPPGTVGLGGPDTSSAAKGFVIYG